jgi:Ni2+-binding GTPase involved in maturation of urease and hydrogenase
LTVRKPVRLVMVGGFLGAGKTTALGALATALGQRELRAGFLTNDQAAGLVDTATLGRLRLPVAEVAGGCFCCRFDDLVDRAQEVLVREPDVLLCEPVGSCTDMTATVLNPLKRYYGEVFRFSPFTVLVDPDRARQATTGRGGESLAEEAAYIFDKQLEEADIIALSKADSLAPGEADRLARSLEGRWGKPVLAASATRGDGVEAWLDLLLGDAAVGAHPLREIDYDIYARGEALLGWLNASVHLLGEPAFAPATFLRTLMSRLQVALAQEEAPVMHVKASLETNDQLFRANLTRTAGPVVYAEPELGPAESTADAQLLLNARVQIDPESLRQIAVAAIERAAAETGADAMIETMESFRPAYPRPPYRLMEAA